MNGWIKIHRSIERWEWVDDPVMFYFWGRLLLLANWEDRQFRGQTIPRGSFLTSYRGLAAKLKLSVRQVRTCIGRLVDSGQICVFPTHFPTQFATQITICNYASYQDDGHSERHSERQSSDTVATQFPEDTLYENKEEIKNIRNNPRARENWRHLSSMRMDQLRVTGQSVADFKRSLLLQEVNEVAAELGLSRTDIEAFMQKWGESSPGSDTIRAEYEATFNTKERAKNYKGVGKPVSRGVTVQELMSRR